MTVPAYLIVESHITDMERFKAYAAEAPAAVAAAGGEYLARGGRHESREGDWQPHRMTVLRFPSYEEAKAFYGGEMYRSARAKRAGTTDYFNMILVEGVSPAA